MLPYLVNICVCQWLQCLSAFTVLSAPLPPPKLTHLSWEQRGWRQPNDYLLIGEICRLTSVGSVKHLCVDYLGLLHPCSTRLLRRPPDPWSRLNFHRYIPVRDYGRSHLRLPADQAAWHWLLCYFDFLQRDWLLSENFGLAPIYSLSVNLAAKHCVSLPCRHSRWSLSTPWSDMCSKR